ncbi:3-dehydroquinate synthase, chloroplastic [Sesamum angolense]|uniref:3-dehydroquinate synthase n=1 Tax=Sesamum angolense TaxID=2727404 RepID=A0AAE1W8J6_9LAMI|nr:3-dehydroquinate synthase, chloroplastic [Sesamum angolense]
MSSATGNINGYSNNQPMITVNVDLGPRSYPVYIGSGLLDHQPGLLSRHVDGKQALIVTNSKIAPLFLDKTVNALKQGNPQISVDTLILPDGEQFKNMESVMKVFDAAVRARMDRRCTFVAVGGGVVGDICGYAAASYLRGVNYIHVPTTFMSQVDSSVGGKTGVNYRVGKNLIGAIHQPMCVVVDTHTLNSLPNRELVSGFAESIKCGLVRDGQYFEWIENNLQALLARDPKAVAYAIKRSCEIKGEIVRLDEKENGIRAILNFGHTFGHAIETSCGYGNWLHGEAVAVGMMDRCFHREAIEKCLTTCKVTDYASTNHDGGEVQVRHGAENRSYDGIIQHELWPLNEVDPQKVKFPCCVVWTPLPVVSWLAPFIGHVGVCREDGTIIDFSGSNLIQVDDFAFGPVGRYLQLDRKQGCFPPTLAGHTCKHHSMHAEYGTAITWDDAIQSSSRHYEHKSYNLFTCNCHSFVANCLNRMCYGDR